MLLWIFHTCNAGTQIVSGGYFGQLTDPTYVSVRCMPNQEAVSGCNIQRVSCVHSAGVICQPATDNTCTMPLVSTCPTNNITITQTKTNTCQERTLDPLIATTTVQITNYTCTATPISTPELMYTTKYVTEYTCTAMPISTPELMYTTKYVTKYTCAVTPNVMSELIRTKYVTNNCTSPTIENATPYTLSSLQQHSQSSQDSNCNTTTGYNNSIASTGGLGAFTGMLVLALIGVSIGWVCTCVITKRKKTGTYNIHR